MSSVPQTAQTPEPDLLTKIRAGFILKGTTMNAWCAKHAINRPNATMAILGGWRGPKAKRLVARIKRAAGVEEAI